MKKESRRIKDSEGHTPETMSKTLVQICYRTHAPHGETAAVKALIEKVTKHKMSDFTPQEYVTFVQQILEAK